MATATKKSRAAMQLASSPLSPHIGVPESPEPLVGRARPVDLAARRAEADAERWLDEADSLDSEAVIEGLGATLSPLPTALALSTHHGYKPTYTCPECEHVLRVSGLGRHRVYFERGAEGSETPVIDRVCPACGHGLPGKNQP